MAGAALRAPARGQAAAGRRRAAPHRPARRLRARADRPRRASSGATATSSSTRSATADDGGLVCGFHAPGSWERIVAVDGLPARLRARQRGARGACSPGAASAGSRAYDRRTHEGLAAQPRRARGPPHRRAAGAPRHLARRARPDRPGRGRRAPTALIWTRAAGVGETTAGGATSCCTASRGDRGGARRPALPHQRRGVLPDEHRDGRAALRRRGRVRGAPGLGARLRPLLRHRDDRADAGARAPARCGASRSSRRRSPTRSPTRGATRSATRASSPATCAWRCATSSRRPAAPTSSSSTRRARASARRSCGAIIEAAPKRIVYVSCNPTTLAPNAAQLVEAGYALRRVRPVDMFPQTPHIECVALLERGLAPPLGPQDRLDVDDRACRRAPRAARPARAGPRRRGPRRGAGRSGSGGRASGS